MSSVENLIAIVMGELRQIARTETVVGEPVTVGDTVILPVSKISFGFGAGGGGDEKGPGGSGTGGGVTIEPVAFVAITGGKPQLISLKSKEIKWSKILELMPDLIGRFGGGKKKDEGKEEAKKSGKD
ncbi:MAG: spore germination protein GerW family protein [Candidatus Latescibacterota bacterium]